MLFCFHFKFMATTFDVLSHNVSCNFPRNIYGNFKHPCGFFPFSDENITYIISALLSQIFRIGAH